MDLLNALLKTHTILHLANELSLSASTIQRWIEQKQVPKQYTLDLHRLAETPVDLTTFSFKDKDQFFTKPEIAQWCMDRFLSFLNEKQEDPDAYWFVEPSAGSGAFLGVLPQDRTVALDIEPRDERILAADFLKWTPPTDGKWVVFGNPPFGLRGNLALRFINHASQFADFVCFILPQLFESDGKGVPKKRVKGMTLVVSEKLPETEFLFPDGRSVAIHCVFQIWSKYDTPPTKNAVDLPDIKIYSLSDGGTPSSTRNKSMLDRCDVYLPSTCFGVNKIRAYSSFEDLPNRRGYGIVFLANKEFYLNLAARIDWSRYSFSSTNSASNLRSSQILSAFSDGMVNLT